jgi:hypothetical protein
VKDLRERFMAWLRAQPESIEEFERMIEERAAMPTAKVPGCTSDQSGPLTAACAPSTNQTNNGFTANGLIGGTIPAGAMMQLRYAQTASGPTWNASPQFPAVAGPFSHTFTNVPAGSYVVRVDVVDPATQTAILTSSVDCSATVTGSSAGCSAGSGTRQVATIGDSLTAGGTNFYSYRGQLQTRLSASGVPFDMVGPQDHGPTQGLGAEPDRQTSAFGGAWIAENHGQPNTGAQQVSDLASANTIVINLGTNDFFNVPGANTPNPNAVAQYQALFAQARTKFPDADIVLVTVRGFPALNSAIASLAAGDSRVKVADVAGLSMTGSDFTDGTHYTQAGATKVGDAIANAVLLTSCFSGGNVQPTCTPPALTIASVHSSMTRASGSEHFTAAYSTSHVDGASLNVGARLIHNNVGASQVSSWYNGQCTHPNEFSRYMRPWLVVGLKNGAASDFNLAYEAVAHNLLVKLKGGGWVDMGKPTGFHPCKLTDNSGNCGVSVATTQSDCGNPKTKLEAGSVTHPFTDVIDIASVARGAANPGDGTDFASNIEDMIISWHVRPVPWDPAQPIGNYQASGNKLLAVAGIDPYQQNGPQFTNCNGAVASSRCVEVASSGWTQVDVRCSLDASDNGSNNGTSNATFNANPPPGYN